MKTIHFASGPEVFDGVAVIVTEGLRFAALKVSASSYHVAQKPARSRDVARAPHACRRVPTLVRGGDQQGELQRDELQNLPVLSGRVRSSHGRLSSSQASVDIFRASLNKNCEGFAKLQVEKHFSDTSDW